MNRERVGHRGLVSIGGDTDRRTSDHRAWSAVHVAPQHTLVTGAEVRECDRMWDKGEYEENM